MTDQPRVLDLSAIFDRPTVKLGAKAYELRNRDEFSLLELDQLMRLMGRAEGMKGAVEDEEALGNASELLAEVAKLLIVDLDVKVPDLAMLAITEFWVGLFTEAAPGGPPPRSRRTTAASSRGSKRSTAATPKRGSTSPRGR